VVVLEVLRLAAAGEAKMLRREIEPRKNLAAIAEDVGFNFHTIDGEVYWQEDRFYQFTLEQIEKDLEEPTNDIHAMCLDLVDEVVKDEYLLNKLAIPSHLHDWVATSWKKRDPSLYGRVDFSYGGKGSAKFLEYNAQTPTSLYEAGFFQWNWLADQVDSNNLPSHSDQFNKLQEAFILRFHHIKKSLKGFKELYFACCKESAEDRATVDYMRDCAHQAGVQTNFVFIEDMGMGMHHGAPVFTDHDDYVIQNIFMLYPFEMMYGDNYGQFMHHTETQFFEPPWKAILSNKGILPLLWERHKGHPNLLPSYFSGEEKADLGGSFVSKPLFSREGENIDVVDEGKLIQRVDGMYGHIPTIKQKFHALPKFGSDYTLIGSWVIGDEALGLTIREDNSLVTKDTSRFIPHIILG